MMNCQIKVKRMEVDVEPLQTVGDRLRWLLRYWGRANRGSPYTQTELGQMLSGTTPAPNGKQYDVQTAKSTVSLWATDEREMSYGAIIAICEIFHCSADWLLRGVETDKEIENDRYMTPEADEIAALVDGMAIRTRQRMVTIAKILLEADQEQQQRDNDLIRILKTVRLYLTDEDRRHIDDPGTHHKDAYPNNYNGDA